MTNYQRAKKKVIQIEQKTDTLLDKLVKTPITFIVVGVVGLLAVYGLIKLVL